MNRKSNARIIVLVAAAISMVGQAGSSCAADLNLATAPLFLTQAVPPLTLLVMGRDHKLYYEAYNDASDLNGDGIVDVGYKPTTVDYFGYFDSHKCYTYDSGNGRFTPASTTTDKKCSGSWSGDFLNYLTTSRMDALRKVFYGGYRSTDDTNLTVLQRAYIPEDAHSWGKEYESVARDGYNITEYTPLSLPATGTRHLFANTTLSDNGSPLLRVLTNSRYRIWEWVSIERPVAGTQCATGNNSRADCAVAGSTVWEIVPASNLQALTQTTYDLALKTGNDVNVAHPNNDAEYTLMVNTYATNPNKWGSGAASTINGSGNPFAPAGIDTVGQRDYLTIFQGQILIPANGTYTFAVDGDDAVELRIDGNEVVGWYGGHSECVCHDHSGSVTLTAGLHNLTFRHEENYGDDSYHLYWQRTIPSSVMTDYAVRVEVCKTNLLEANCKQYGSATPSYKPTGLLQDYGENDRMLFGLLSGSYRHNLSGGVLRKNIGSFSDEITSSTGQLSSTVGIAKTMDRLRMIGFNYSCPYCYTTPPGIVTRAITEADGQGYQMWGNPIGEMMYEGLRYFAGKASPTPDFANGVGGSGTYDTQLGLPLPTWSDPYASHPWCSKPFMLVLSDINPSYDTDQLPGTAFGSFSGDVSGLNVESVAQDITDGETGIAGQRFIGQVGDTQDGACTPKAVTSLANIRGLCPEEPTKLGGYYSASIAYYGRTHDLNPIDGGTSDKGQKLNTFVVALASPLPRINIPVGNQTVTLVPFAKSVGGSGIDPSSNFQPTDQIVDFYVETIKNTQGGNNDASVNSGRPYYKFRINYEDTEQGSDHDMDAIVMYEISLNADNTITVHLTSDYAAGSVIQHMGYIISGTTADGIYLEVRDSDTAAGNDPDYRLDTPPGQAPGGTWQDSAALPLTASRTFTAGTSASAGLLKDPLWYAAKWGGFQEKYTDVSLINNRPDQPQEWDADNNGVPDNYFLVTNALHLGQQLSAAFEEIMNRTSSASSVATNSGALRTNTRLFQARFTSGSWTGQLLSFPVDPSNGSLAPNAEWDAAPVLNSQNWDTGRKIITYKPSTHDGVPFRWTQLDTTPQQDALNTNPDSGTTDSQGSARLDYLRGSNANEGGSGNHYRTRTSKLGDLVQSDPFYVGSPAFFYPDNLESAPYSTFKNGKKNRKSVVYVGGNDGMLHGFDASVGTDNRPTTSSGEEVIAYVPNRIFANLSKLTSQNYQHRYFVDGSPTAGDAFISGAWKTVLVGGLRGGGQGYFALDITDPATFSEANAANMVLWEFTDSDDADLGYSFSQPAIVKMQNGKWAAVFGNGYNNTEADGLTTTSTTGHAVLYIVFIADGIDGTWSASDFVKIDTGVGTTSAPNGLATPTPVDVDGDSKVDYIYAGDLQGNLWKFDVTSSTSSNWDVAFKTGTTKNPLFTAVDPLDSNIRQPITSAPEVGFHPAGLEGFVVYFGTGKYIETGDNNVSGARTQTFYGIWDKNDGGTGSNGFARSDLLSQTVEEVVEVSGTNFRVVSNDPMTWRTPTSPSGKMGWYLDLPTIGERQVSDSILRNDRIIFTTLIPSSDICEFGGTGWLMELNPKNGGRLDETPFDVNNDGEFNNSDFVRANFDANGDGTSDNDDVPTSGKQSNIGIISKPTIIASQTKEYKYTSGSKEGGIEGTANNPGAHIPGRKSWRQVR